MAVIKISYERLYNLGNFENEKFIDVVTVEEGDVAGAFAQAREATDAARSAALIDRLEQEERRRREAAEVAQQRRDAAAEAQRKAQRAQQTDDDWL
jgi:hypothetical protein